MQNFVQPGRVLDFAAPYAVNAGGGAKLGAIFGVAKDTLASGAAGAFVVEGVFNLTKKDSQAWSVGDRIFWDDTNKWCSSTSTDGMFVGYATAAVGGGSGLTVGTVRLAPSHELVQGKQPAVTALTAASGSASTTLADVTATPTQTLINNNFKSVATQLNAVIAALQAAGILT